MFLKPEQARQNAEKMKKLYRILYNKYWVDEVYLKFLINPLIKFSQFLWAQVDIKSD